MNAVFFDGWSLAEQPVQVTLREHELVIASAEGGELRVWSLDALHVDGMQEGHVYHLTHASAPQEELVLRDAALAEQLLGRAKRVNVLPGGKNKLGYGLSLLAALVAVMGGAYLAAPKISMFVAQRIPLEQERALGGELEFLLRLDDCRNDPARATLRELVARLADAHDAKYDVHITRSSVPNAFALPGGTILVTQGFLREAKSADEVAGVLAHEVEHIAQRHVLAGALRGTLLTALWSLTVGDYSGLMALDPQTAYNIVNLGFSRDDEQAADDGAVVRLHRAGYSHRGLQAFFARLSKDEDEETATSWLSTHPSTHARVAALVAVPDVQNAKLALTDAQMKQLHHACEK